MGRTITTILTYSSSVTPAVYKIETWCLVIGLGFQMSLDFFVRGLHTRTAVARNLASARPSCLSIMTSWIGQMVSVLDGGLRWVRWWFGWAMASLQSLGIKILQFNSTINLYNSEALKVCNALLALLLVLNKRESFKWHFQMTTESARFLQGVYHTKFIPLVTRKPS